MTNPRPIDEPQADAVVAAVHLGEVLGARVPVLGPGREALRQEVAVPRESPAGRTVRLVSERARTIRSLSLTPGWRW